jgi:hypothetical protein
MEGKGVFYLTYYASFVQSPACGHRGDFCSMS